MCSIVLLRQSLTNAVKLILMLIKRNHQLYTIMITNKNLMGSDLVKLKNLFLEPSAQLIKRFACMYKNNTVPMVMQDGSSMLWVLPESTTSKVFNVISNQQIIDYRLLKLKSKLILEWIKPSDINFWNGLLKACQEEWPNIQKRTCQKLVDHHLVRLQFSNISGAVSVYLNLHGKHNMKSK